MPPTPFSIHGLGWHALAKHLQISHMLETLRHVVLLLIASTDRPLEKPCLCKVERDLLLCLDVVLHLSVWYTRGTRLESSQYLLEIYNLSSLVLVQ